MDNSRANVLFLPNLVVKYSMGCLPENEAIDVSIYPANNAAHDKESNSRTQRFTSIIKSSEFLPTEFIKFPKRIEKSGVNVPARNEI